MVSIICPAFNEEAGIGGAVGQLRACLDALSVPAEVLIINDGSTDRTVAAAARAIGTDDRFRIFTHKANFGRGRAMRTGFAEAGGDIIVTTEADLSWGQDIVQVMLDALDRHAGIDAVFASPHVAGGGYRNVPWFRIVLSRWGNRLLRMLYPSSISMTTGMTRAYRAWVIQGQRFANDGKELHLEIAHRLMSLGHRIGEVPAILSWPADSDERKSRGGRTDWSKIRRLMASHVAFGVLQGIGRIIVPTIALLSAAILVFGIWAIRNLLMHDVSIFLVMVTGLLLILWVNLTVGYFLLGHVFHIEADVWRLDQSLADRDGPRTARRHYYYEESLGQARVW
ncbi:MAG: arnC 5 [Acidobacteria bacterium]|nr:arnC 5 [Acidobacteriota bacterium]